MPLNELVQTTWTGNDFFGFRGISKIGDVEYARMWVNVNSPKGEVLQIELPLHCLPYLPDMSSNSEFVRNGNWYRYPEAEKGYQIVGEGSKLIKVILAGQEIYNSQRNRI